jgi:hypothetical protein
MFFKDVSQLEREAPLLRVRSPLVIKALNTMGYDAANVGWMDLMLPEEILDDAVSGAAFPFLSANVRDESGEPPYKPYLIREFDGFRVGIFGLVSPRVVAGKRYKRGSYRVLDPLGTAREVVEELRRSCDFVIALTSLGVEDDHALARSVEGIDVILGGLTKKVMYTAEVEGRTVIAQAGSKGMRVGRLEVEIRPGGSGPWVPRGEATTEAARIFRWTPVSLQKNIKDHPDILALLEEYRNTLKEQQIARQVSRQPLGPQSRYAGKTTCRECHPRESAQWSRSPHAHAFVTLVGKNQDGNPDCLSCHVTAFAEPGGYRPGSEDPNLANVQCEACHGAGRAHRGRGLINLRVPESVCRGCHNKENSPTFRYEGYLRKLGEHTNGYFRRPPALR